jgi:predicted anti-sigma-YlaC factor YlaD
MRRLRDAGCEHTRELLDRYVEAELADGTPDPSLTAHLHWCPACQADHDGLLALIRKDFICMTRPCS